MLLIDMLKDIKYEVIKGKLDVLVNDIVYDSRNVKLGDAFFALVGFNTDGHDYIDMAIKNGASVVFVSRDVDDVEGATIIRLGDTRVGLSIVARTFFGYPDRELKLVGITGTKGKTTSSWVMREVLNRSGRECGYIGTLGIFYGGQYVETVNTTPEASVCYKYMREMVRMGIKYLVMEVSSQSLKLNRWPGVLFDYGVFTNLSLDHVGDGEHESYQDYANCKKKLFSQSRVGIFNRDDFEYKRMVDGFCGDVYTYGKSKDADIRIVSVDNLVYSGFRGIRVKTEGVISDSFDVSLLGEFNAYNITLVMLVCYLLGVDFSLMKDVFKSVSVKGRMNKINISSKFDLFIDEAYQGVAMENVMKAIESTNPKRIVSVFGCGGNRSRQRRFDCGRVTSEYADVTILTTDNPRYEDNIEIIRDIISGFTRECNYKVIDDRMSAIRYSIENAEDGDVIMILGRGAEEYQEIKGKRIYSNDLEMVYSIINGLSENDCKRLGIIR